MAGVKYAMARTRPEWLEWKTENFLKFLLKPDLTFFGTGVVLILRSVILPGTATVSLSEGACFQLRLLNYNPGSLIPWCPIINFAWK